ncbi:hypothetical protein EXS71_04020 [Candidatus Uhrbacteria bacterium]|nr:hypothetical protein [Candidatus Uhrbacteria bacterium]
MTTLTYLSADSGASYYVFVYKYADPRMDETGSEYDVAGGLEAMMNGMVNNSKNGRLISSRKTNLLNKDALQYEIEVGNERLDGVLLMNENRIYNIMVDYFSAASPKPDFELFVNNFELR